ncbi:uncharacterized protein LOC119083056 [Bradysia coprophila]|uniref:uncharacterized protein LOC119083056 n=1 Tax=Bradysia coprophila TaxID=38358 RepID=UPI00187D793E|nr:uncharacterized protein LOC119083056 [Bradysia coprophila]
MSHRVLQFLLFSINLLCFTAAKEFYDISPKRVICKRLDSKLVYNFTCTTKLINHTMSMSNMELTLQPDVVLTNFYVEIQLYRKFATIVRSFMVKFEQNFCDFLDQKNSSIFYRYLPLAEMRKQGNFYDPCPISGHRYSRNATFYYDSLPEIIPSGKW